MYEQCAAYCKKIFVVGINPGGGGDILESLRPCVRLSVCRDFVRTVCPEPLHFLQPNLVLWCIIMNQSVMRKKMVCYLRGQCHSEVLYNQNVTVCTISFKLSIRSQPNLV